MSTLSSSLLSLSLLAAAAVPPVFQGSDPVDVPFVFAVAGDSEPWTRTAYGTQLTLSRSNPILLKYLTHGIFHPRDKGRVREQGSLLHRAFHDWIPVRPRMECRRYRYSMPSGQRRSAPVELLHDLPRDVGLGHVLQLRVRGELLLRDVFHAREEGSHPVLRREMSEGSYPRTVGTRRAEPTLCRNSFSSSRRRRSNSPDFLNLAVGAPDQPIVLECRRKR